MLQHSIPVTCMLFLLCFFGSVLFTSVPLSVDLDFQVCVCLTSLLVPSFVPSLCSCSPCTVLSMLRWCEYFWINDCFLDYSCRALCSEQLPVTISRHVAGVKVLHVTQNNLAAEPCTHKQRWRILNWILMKASPVSRATAVEELSPGVTHLKVLKRNLIINSCLRAMKFQCGYRAQNHGKTLREDKMSRPCRRFTWKNSF